VLVIAINSLCHSSEAPVPKERVTKKAAAEPSGTEQEKPKRGRPKSVVDG